MPKISEDEFLKKYWDMKNDTRPCDVPKAIHAAILAYQCANETPPTWFFHVQSAKQSAELASIIQRTIDDGDTFKWVHLSQEQIDELQAKSDHCHKTICEKTDLEFKADDLVLGAPAWKVEHRQHKFEIQPVVHGFWMTNKELYDSYGKDKGIKKGNVCLYDSSRIKGRDKKATISNSRQMMRDQACGNHDAIWLGICAYHREVLHNSGLEALKGLESLAEHCGWWSLYNNFAILQDRPIRHHDVRKDGRKHCDTGPWMEWADGSAAWFIDDIEVDRTIVMTPELQTIDEIHNDNNNDRVALRIERMGWPLYIIKSKAKEIDSRHNPIEGAIEGLYETRVGKRLICNDATARIFSLGVPPEVRTCEEAQRFMKPWSTRQVIGRT